MTEANYDEVICPNCVTQFRAVPVNVQNELKALAAQLERLQYEVDAIPAIKEERDDLSSRYETASRLVTSLSDALAKTLKERDALKAERDEFNYSLVSTANRKLRSEVDVLRKERDALKDANRDLQDWFDALKTDHETLKDAARLSLDALDASQGYCSGTHTEDAVKKAIAALKAVI